MAEIASAGWRAANEDVSDRIARASDSCHLVLPSFSTRSCRNRHASAGGKLETAVRAAVVSDVERLATRSAWREVRVLAIVRGELQNVENVAGHIGEAIDQILITRRQPDSAGQKLMPVLISVKLLLD